MKAFFCFVAALLIATGCGGARATLSASNDSGISVVLVHGDTVVATLAPGFRGRVTDLDGWAYPRTIRLTTASGTELGDAWDASGTQGEFNVDMAECGQVFLWLGSPDPSFDLATSIPADACPG